MAENISTVIRPVSAEHGRLLSARGFRPLADSALAGSGCSGPFPGRSRNARVGGSNCLTGNTMNCQASAWRLEKLVHFYDAILPHHTPRRLHEYRPPPVPHCTPSPNYFRPHLPSSHETNPFSHEENDDNFKSLNGVPVPQDSYHFRFPLSVECWSSSAGDRCECQHHATGQWWHSELG